MKIEDNRNKYFQLRNNYPYFIFENYNISKEKKSLSITYTFNLADQFAFSPTIIIPHRDFYQTDNLTVSELQNIVFHIGMVELVSYWKATCSPKIIIKPHTLNEKQVNWWKKLYFNGLGEFFYLNSLKPDINSFVEIVAESGSNLERNCFDVSEETIIPIGGGKDSVVTLELLSKLQQVYPLILNSRGASLETIETAGYNREQLIEIKRSIHPGLIELNTKGFLNGHTPFSALLAFITVLASIITGKRNIALSNESSADESTIVDTNINHQYSKSFEFEKDFRDYVYKYITKDVNYFSFLRPLNELQIGKLFAGFSEYFNVFKSCNVGSKTDIWCRKCPKCLFTYIILTPFIPADQLEKIFGGNMLEDIDLELVFKQLIGVESTKPFECVGTIEEINIALCMCVTKNDFNTLPYLLKYYITTINYSKYRFIDNNEILQNLNIHHFLDDQLLKLIKERI